MTFSLFDVAILIGVSQGFLVAASIWFRAHLTPSKLLLAVLLLVFNALCLKILIHTTGLWHTQVFRYFPLAVELAIQPLMWLYILSLTQIDFKFRKKHLLHFVPCGLSLIYSLFIYILALGEVDFASKDALVNRFYFNTVKEIEDYLSVMSAVVYWVLGLRAVLRFRMWLFSSTSNTDYPTYVWLRNIALLMGLLIVLLALSVALDYFFSIGNVFVHWQIFFVYMAGLIYYLGFRGYQLPDHSFFEINAKEQSLVLSLESVKSTELTPTKFDLSPEKLTDLTQSIVHALESNQVYLDADLNIQKLATIVQVSPALLSAVVNQEFGKNFRNLVNDYRLAHVKRKLTDPASAHLSINGIAFESGFNSEASFYRIFKSAEGMSPKEYMQKSSI
ncbi:MAG: helix-turn-helix domain-containing protein [Cyclobacteriaceae bacterium]